MHEMFHIDDAVANDQTTEISGEPLSIIIA